jgi:hypothetical protein
MIEIQVKDIKSNEGPQFVRTSGYVLLYFNDKNEIQSIGKVETESLVPILAKTMLKKFGV